MLVSHVSATKQILTIFKTELSFRIRNTMLSKSTVLKSGGTQSCHYEGQKWADLQSPSILGKLMLNCMPLGWRRCSGYCIG